MILIIKGKKVGVSPGNVSCNLSCRSATKVARKSVTGVHNSYEMTVSFYYIKVLNLPKPYEGDCHDKPITGIPGYSKYTMSSCKLICETKFVIEKCGCRDALMPGK